LGAVYFVPVTHFFNLRIAVAKVVESPVEMNQVPFGIAQPAVEGIKTAVGVSTIGFGPTDEGFVLQLMNDLWSVTDGNGVPNKNNAGEVFTDGLLSA
jgi:hypothetical protein